MTSIIGRTARTASCEVGVNSQTQKLLRAKLIRATTKKRLVQGDIVAAAVAAKLQRLCST